MHRKYEDVYDVGFFSLLADEEREFGDEQLAASVRYAVDLNICERFIIFVEKQKE